MSIFKRTAICIGAAVLAFSLQNTSYAQNTAQFEGKLDETLKSACHSYMIDALPDAFSWLKNQIFENSPFCNRINSAYGKEEINDALQEEFRRTSASEPSLDRSKKQERNLNIIIECQSEYMCLESRIRFRDTPNAVSQKTYDAVAGYCDRRYGCIQAFFDEWPRDIPKTDPKLAKKLVTFESILKSNLVPKRPNVETLANQQTAHQKKPKKSSATNENSFVKAETQNPSPQILNLNKNIESQCECSMRRSSCFDNPYGPIKKRLAQIEDQRSQVCSRWQTLYGSLGQSSLVDSDIVQTDLDYAEKFIRDADQRGYALIRLAKEDFERIKYRVRKKLPFKNTFEDAKADMLANGPSNSVGPTPARFEGDQSSQQAKLAEDNQQGQQKTSAFLYHPTRLTFADAKAFCQSKGMHIPTVAEAKPHLKEMVPLGDPFWGIWTTDQTAPDKIIGKYRTLRNNGFTEGEHPTFASRVFCFP